MTMLTPWGELLDREAPLPEYPRPQLVRGDWVNLNGAWDYAITRRPTTAADADGRDVGDPSDPPPIRDGRIIVPFSPETALSGVGRTLRADEDLWYRRAFALPRPLRDGERAILHFGAVDQSCRVAVDGVEVGGHTGGYLPFVFDITSALADGSDVHDLVVAVRDVTDASWHARGKQSSRPGGIWYTPQSGIWQTVWLEIVPRVAVDALVLTPDLDAGAVVATVDSAHADDDRALVEVIEEGRVVASAVLPAGVATAIALPGPVRLWSPDDPFLYDVRVTLGDDRVTSYVGMRSFGVGTDDRGFARLLLNGEPHLPVGLLDQGYWPDGGYTAPSDAALEYDIRLAKHMGFTMLRKHIKVEPLRWYHHCDRIGMLVWQDAVNGGAGYNPLVITAPVFGAPQLDDRRHRRFGRRSAAGRAQFETELSDMIEHLRSVPSISMWVPFNEGWGQFDAARITAAVRALDPTRPVDHASGWHDQGAGDLQSLHVYFRPVSVPRRRDRRVLALTEYGGYSLAVLSHTWSDRVFGYRRYRSRDRLIAALERLHDRQIAPAIVRGLAATVYTQLADVEEEVNGLVTYDRRFVKVPVETMRAINDRLRAAAGDARAGARATASVPASSKEPA
jgi:beta-galactosidase/beta-glucuronidase